jgi:hypothetical protein
MLPTYFLDFIIIVIVISSSSGILVLSSHFLLPSLASAQGSSSTPKSTSPLCLIPGVVMIPGVTQLTEKDLKYRLQISRAKSIITTNSLAPHVDAISADCPSLQTKLLVSDSSRPGWMNFKELLR